MPDNRPNSVPAGKQGLELWSTLVLIVEHQGVLIARLRRSEFNDGLEWLSWMQDVDNVMTLRCERFARRFQKRGIRGRGGGDNMYNISPSVSLGYVCLDTQKFKTSLPRGTCFRSVRPFLSLLDCKITR